MERIVFHLSANLMFPFHWIYAKFVFIPLSISLEQSWEHTTFLWSYAWLEQLCLDGPLQRLLWFWSQRAKCPSLGQLGYFHWDCWISPLCWCNCSHYLSGLNFDYEGLFIFDLVFAKLTISFVLKEEFGSFEVVWIVLVDSVCRHFDSINYYFEWSSYWQQCLHYCSKIDFAFVLHC